MVKAYHFIEKSNDYQLGAWVQIPPVSLFIDLAQKGQKSKKSKKFIFIFYDDNSDQDGILYFLDDIKSRKWEKQRWQL